jgi:uncharacterized protein (TIGR03083 family)
MTLTHVACCDVLTTEIAQFVDTLHGADMTIPVATCGDWLLSDLVEHLGQIHRWAATMVRAKSDVRIDRREIDFDMPASSRGLADWFAAGGAGLVSTLRAADPDAAMWAWGLDQHVRFWSRRQLHETAIHHADAKLALGREPAMTTPVAVDSIDELLTNLPCAGYFAPGIDKLRGDGEMLQLEATDVDNNRGDWLITLGADGFTWEHGRGKGSVVVRGAVNDLALLMWGRRRATDAALFEIRGDRALLDSWLANAQL